MTRFTRGLDLIRLAAKDAPPPRYVPPADHREPYRSVVYYVRVDRHIKIGYSGRVYERMRNYPPYAELLATEAAPTEREAERHAQFRADLAHGREWFNPSAALIQHINELRKRNGQPPLTAAELAA